MANNTKNYNNMATAMGLFGSILSGVGTYYSSKASSKAADFRSQMNEINARMSQINARSAERTAQSILEAGNIQQGQIGLKAGKIKSSQKASQGARGIAIGVGSAAEEVATTDLMKEIDRLQINANAVRQANAARMQGVNAMTQSVNFSNQSLIDGAMASGASPGMNAFSSIVTQALPVAASWYRRKAVSQSGGSF